MASARYWRVVGVDAYAGGDLELGELQLYTTSGRADVGAVLSSSHSPIAGTLGHLADDSTSTAARFSAESVRSAGFFVAWDLGAPLDVVGVRVGASTSRDRFLSSLTLQFFDGAGWVTRNSYGRFPWPGVLEMDQGSAGGSFSDPDAVLFLDGSVDFTDGSPVARPITVNPGVTISDEQTLYGPKSMLFNGTTGYLTSGASSSLAFASGEDFAISFNTWKSANGSDGYDSVVSTTTNGSATDGWFVELSATRGFLFVSQGVFIFSVSLNPNIAAWKNWEVSRKNGILRAFGGGEKIYEAVDTRAYPQNGLTIGAEYPGKYLFKGFLSQVLISKGRALHDADFVPSSLVAQGPIFDPRPVRTAPDSALVAASAVVPPHSTHARGVNTARDMEFGGPGTIYGTTKVKGTPNLPTKARVVLLHQRSKQPVRETWSDPVTGAFAFTGIDTTQQFLTLAEDAAGNFRPVAASRLVPEVLP